jgi:hypothetical protein
MVKSNWKYDGYRKQEPQHVFVTDVQDQQSKESNHKQSQFGGHNICQYCSYKEALLTFED